MNKESLEKAREIITEEFPKKIKDKQDVLELMMNLYTLLDEKNYEEDIKILIRKRGERNE